MRQLVLAGAMKGTFSPWHLCPCQRITLPFIQPASSRTQSQCQLARLHHQVGNGLSSDSFGDIRQPSHVDDMGFGGPEYLNGAHGGYRIGYLDRIDINGPRALTGLWIGGDGAHLVENSDFGGLADSMVIDANGWIEVQNLTMHVAGWTSTGTNNLYPSTSFLADGFHIYNKHSYSSFAHNIFYDEANYSIDPNGNPFDGNSGELTQSGGKSGYFQR